MQLVGSRSKLSVMGLSARVVGLSKFKFGRFPPYCWENDLPLLIFGSSVYVINDLFFVFCRRSKSKTQLVDGVWALGLWCFGVLFFDDISSPTKRRWHVFIRLSTYSSPEVGKNKIFISVAHGQALFNIIRHLVV